MPVVETIFFYVFAFGALLTSIAVAWPMKPFNNPLYSALSLILCFFCFSGLYGLLSAHFMAVIQILVYGGAIMVLFVFIIMLLNLREEEFSHVKFRLHHLLAIAVGLGIFTFSMMSVAPLIDRARIDETRQAAETRYQQAVEAAEATEDTADDDVRPIAVATPTAVPGLYSDLNEPALNAAYARQLAGYRAGTDSPSARKYRPFDPNQKLEIPPVLAGQNARGGPLEEPVSWGTVEPLSILLVGRFVVPFELTALLLLAAIVGAVIIAKKRL